jgi:hypothetical protein
VETADVSFFLLRPPCLDPLVEGLENASVDRSDQVHCGIELFFGQSCFPCVRKAPVHSGITVARHCDGQTKKNLLSFTEAFNGMSVTVELPEIRLFHRWSRWSYYVLGTGNFAIRNPDSPR